MVFDLSRFKQSDGRIRYEELIRFWRKEVLACSAATLVDVFNEALDTDYSQRWWERMEKENKLPTDIKRRLVIAAMLNLPIAYLGVHIPPLMEDTNQLPSLTTSNSAIDIAEYTDYLASLWLYRYGRKTEEIAGRIGALQESVLYGPRNDKKKVVELLCDYLIFWSNMEGNNNNIPLAYTVASKAIRLAKDHNLADLQAKAYYIRGCIGEDSWRNEGKKKSSVLNQALKDIGKAYTLIKEAKKEGSHLEIALLLASGVFAIPNAQDKKEKLSSLKKIDRAKSILSLAPQDPFFIKIDEGWLSAAMAEALIDAQWPDSAIAELSHLRAPESTATTTTSRRFLTASIIEAEAYKTKLHYEMATAHALDALEKAKDEGDMLSIGRIEALYKDMRENDRYKNSTDLMMLGVEIIKAHYPVFFA